MDTLDAIRREFNQLLKALDQADRRAQLINRILSNPHLLQYSTPETKGMIIYQLTRHDDPDRADLRNHKGLSAFAHRKEAIKQTLLKEAGVRPRFIASRVVRYHFHWQNAEAASYLDLTLDFKNWMGWSSTWIAPVIA